MVSSRGTRKRSSLKSSTSASVRSRASTKSSGAGTLKSVVIASPTGSASRSGNSVTALRYSRLLRSLGYRTRITASTGTTPDADLLVALHAHRSAGLVRAFRKAFPHRPVIVVLTGTDIYASRGLSVSALAALAAADAIITLQPLAIRRLPARLRSKALPVIQSAEPVAPKPRKKTGIKQFCVLGHLRREKDPLLAARALRYVASADVRIEQAGALLDVGYADRIERLQRGDSRYRYRGELSRMGSARLLASSEALIVSSRSEGGANVVSEAIANGVPVLASTIEGNVGILGRRYRGYFASGSSVELARLIDRIWSDPAFVQMLKRQIAGLRPLVEPAREREALSRAIARALRHVRVREASHKSPRA